MPKIRIPLLAATAFALAFAFPASATITDASNDYVPGFLGSRAGDLDVLSASATFNDRNDLFNIGGTMVADVGTTSRGLYVWGVDRGQGTARFNANGISGVLFDMVVVLNLDGSGVVTDLTASPPQTKPLPAGSIQINGKTITANVPESLMPSRGRASSDYSWNLWPRDGSLPAGFGQISDFAPDNSNFVNATIPEPASAALLALGTLGMVLTRRRQR